MTIRKIGMLTEVVPGQWICMDPILRDHIVTGPREVARRSGKRVYFRNRHGEDEGNYCSISSVIALCDTQQEALAFYAVSQAQYDELQAVKEKYLAQAQALYGTSPE